MNSTRKLFLSLITIFLIGILPAQEKQKLTLETMNDPELFRALSLPRTWWLDDKMAILYDTRKPAAEQQLEVLDPSSGKRAPLLDFKKASESFKGLFPDGKVPRLAPVPHAFSSNGSLAIYLIEGDIYLLDVKNATFSRISDTKEEEKDVNFSPDGHHLAYVRSNNLYTFDIDQKKERQLTTDGSSTILNGTLSWVYWE
jgi:Tol biopolymer transport system component